MSATFKGVRGGHCVFSSDTSHVRLMVILGVNDVEDVAQRQHAVRVIHGGD